jgi:hypothetical protein
LAEEAEEAGEEHEEAATGSGDVQASKEAQELQNEMQTENANEHVEKVCEGKGTRTSNHG